MYQSRKAGIESIGIYHFILCDIVTLWYDTTTIFISFMEVLEMTDSRLFAIYSRKSKFTGKGESIENQIEMCRQHIRIYYGDE
ncbi:MAG: hypothetical protein J6B74_05950, partial [Ruminococcus sp.]|nr:hypothetical protein [Ruminococcus sp.]